MNLVYFSYARGAWRFLHGAPCDYVVSPRVEMSECNGSRRLKFTTTNPLPKNGQFYNPYTLLFQKPQPRTTYISIPLETYNTLLFQLRAFDSRVMSYRLPTFDRLGVWARKLIHLLELK